MMTQGAIEIKNDNHTAVHSVAPFKSAVCITEIRFAGTPVRCDPPLLCLESDTLTVIFSNPKEPMMSQQTTTDKAATKTKRVADPELQTLAKLDELLAGLDIVQAQRSLIWLVERYGPLKRPQVNQSE